MFTRAKNALEAMALSETHLQSRITDAWFSLRDISSNHIADSELAANFKALYEKQNSGDQGIGCMSSEQAETEIRALVRLCADLIQYAA